MDFSCYRFLIVAYSSTFQIIETDRGTPNTPCAELDSCLIVSNLPFVPGASQPDVNNNNNNKHKHYFVILETMTNHRSCRVCMAVHGVKECVANLKVHLRDCFGNEGLNNHQCKSLEKSYY